MREYRLTVAGRKEAKIARLQRNEILDYLYPKAQYTMEHLKSMFGADVRTKILSLIKQGYVEEVGMGGF
jgi:hypothetical protein